MKGLPAIDKLLDLVTGDNEGNFCPHCHKKLSRKGLFAYQLVADLVKIILLVELMLHH